MSESLNKVIKTTTLALSQLIPNKLKTYTRDLQGNTL